MKGTAAATSTPRGLEPALEASGPGVARRSLTTYRAIEELLVACLEEAQRCGDVDSTVDVRRLDSLLVAVERGVEALGRPGWTRRRCDRRAAL